MTALPRGEGAVVPSPVPTPVTIGDATLYHADCRDVLRGLPDNSIDAVVTDPPYALVSIQKRFGKPGSAPAKGNDAYMRASAGFMGANWDNGETAFSEEFWAEVLRVLKPGGHVVAFSGTRTYHRMAVAIEDAGFEIRDQCKWMHEDDSERDAFLASLNDEQRAQFIKLFEEHGAGQLSWDYGSGFPKSHDVSKAIDKAVGAEREKVRVTNVRNPKATGGGKDGMEGATRPWIEAALERGYHEKDGDEPATDAAREWQGWGTALKPAWEPICLARKPLIGTVAENVLAHGTGALNIDGCRVGTNGEKTGGSGNAKIGTAAFGDFAGNGGNETSPLGRWPANIVHDGSDEVLSAFPETGASSGAPRNNNTSLGSSGANVFGKGGAFVGAGHADAGGSAARFFYCAKASRKDRDEGLSLGDGTRANTHPTVKPTDIMRWLCRLVTPPGGTILDPFMGSGSTGKAALLEGFRFIGCEREDEYMPIAEARIAAALRREPQQAAPAAQAANDNQQRDLFNVA